MQMYFLQPFINIMQHKLFVASISRLHIASEHKVLLLNIASKMQKNQKYHSPKDKAQTTTSKKAKPEEHLSKTQWNRMGHRKVETCRKFAETKKCQLI